jgi:hypothetical protein
MPGKTKAQFDKEIGNDVDAKEVARLWRYVAIQWRRGGKGSVNRLFILVRYREGPPEDLSACESCSSRIRLTPPA